VDGRELKRIWRSGQVSFGAWVALTDPLATTALCDAGYEWLMIDAEHRPFDAETLRTLIATMRCRGVLPLVRVRANDEAIIKQAFDLGAEGVAVPVIRSVEDAKRAVAFSRLPPLGARGCGPNDAAEFYANRDSYLAHLDDNHVLILWIEHIGAVNQLDQILTLPGVDALVLGPVDLTYSMGLPWQISHPQVQAAIETTVSKAVAAHMPVGISVTAEDSESWRAKGVNILFLGTDLEFILHGGAAARNRLCQATGRPGVQFRARAW